MSPLMLSVALALTSAVAYAAAAIVQERVAASAGGPRYAPLRSPAWWVSVALNGVGATLHVAALAYGPLSLVQPLGALTIVFALPMAALFVGRRAGRRAWRGALMATAGLAGLLGLTSGAEAGSLSDGERWLLAGAAFGAVAVLFTAARLVGRSVLRGVVLAAAAGASFGIASVLTKAVAEEWTPRAPLAEWTGLLVLSVFAVTGLLLSQASYRGAGLAAPLATVTVVNPVVAAAVGLTLFGEGFRYGTAGTVAALLCGTVAAAGLVQLTLDRTAVAPESPSSAPEAPSASDGDAPRPEVRQGVDVGAVPGSRPDLEVEVRSRAVAGRP
ncbi:DMT family transporter [Streptomyces litmocidini]|uniref:DMT family transporter n=1 Tax=Streptomyces litmocidini TaxID=67318 RepID=UPI00167E8D99|nr:DMT family transporter [Streptomyces litmocidini]